ncbi:MAG: PRC-barrel domain-containing protein [Hasllibacter sp.]
MLRTLSAAALAAVAAAPALADAHVFDTADLIRTRDITGGPVYSIADRYDEAAWMDLDDDEFYGYNNYGYGTDYDQIGEIEDIVLDRSGQMIGIVAEVGGFLDIGDKHVMVPINDIRLVPVDDVSYSFVTRLSEEQLEELPSVDEGFFD